MKLAYISEYDVDKKADGVSIKINLQMESFKRRGIETEHCRCFDAYKTKKLGKILSQIPLLPAFQRYSKLAVPNVDVMYVRKPIVADRYFINFLSRAKQQGIKKIVLEIPVYPYDGQIAWKWYKYLILFKDIVNRRKMKKYVDLITTYTFDKEIFGIPAMHIENALDFSLIKKRSIIKKQADRIDLLAVSSMAFWHGYDRLIEGMNNYYSLSNDKEVFLHLVGDGPERDNYLKLINKYNLNKHIKYYGLKCGEELDEIYNYCDIGFCTLACHRKKKYLTSELKSREYAAKGLPMVGSCEISLLNNSECDFFLKVSADEKPIDINTIVDWYQQLLKKYGNEETLNDKIREYGNQHLDIYESMKPVADYFLDSLKG